MNFKLNENLIENFRKGILIFLSIEVISLSISIAVSSIAFVLAVILWVALLIIEKRWVRTPLDFAFLFYILAEIISAIFALEQSQAFVYMKRLFIFTVFYMSFYSFKNWKELRIFFIIFFTFIGILSSLEIILKFILNIDRIGVFQHYMTTGGIKMIVCLYIIPFLFQKGLQKKEKIFLISVFIPILLSLLLTMTRSSWFGFVLGIFVFGVIKDRKTLIYLGIFIILFALFAPSNFKQRALSGFDPNYEPNKPRIHMIETGWRIFQDYPLFGIGDTDVKKTYLRYTVPLEPNEGGHLHNNFMQILVTLGTFGFIAYITLFTVLLIYLIKTFNLTKGNPLSNSLSIIPIIVFFAFHLNGLFEWNFGDQEIAILLWFTMGLSVIARQIYQKETSEDNNPLPTSL
jgi:putative inorganic carbon (hco3(-)) transporter